MHSTIQAVWDTAGIRADTMHNFLGAHHYENLAGAFTHQIDWGASTNAGGEFAFLQVACDSAHGKLQTSLAGSADLLLACSFAFAASRHVGVENRSTGSSSEKEMRRLVTFLEATCLSLYCCARAKGVIRRGGSVRANTTRAQHALYKPRSFRGGHHLHQRSTLSADFSLHSPRRSL